MSFKLNPFNNLLDRLNEDELHFLIDLLPADNIIKIVKKFPQKFKEEVKGSPILAKSTLLIQRVKKTLYRDVLEQNKTMIELLNEFTYEQIARLEKLIITETSSEDFLDQALRSNNINDFGKLLEIIIRSVKPKYIKLFFKLVNHQLTDEQNQYIDNELQYLLKTKELREEIERKLAAKFEEQVSEIEKKFKTEITNLICKNKEIRETLSTKNRELSQELVQERVQSKILEDNIIQQEKKNTQFVISLQNEIERLKIFIEKLNGEKVCLTQKINDKEIDIQRLHNTLHDKYENFYEKAQVQWQIKNQMLLDTQKQLEDVCNTLFIKENSLNESVKSLETKKSELENKISIYNNTINEYINNIDTRLIEKALSDSMLKLISPEPIQKLTNTDITLYIKLNKKVLSAKITKSINNFAENIAINLENIGVKDNPDEIAKYIVGILAAGMIPLICGYKAREVATAISTAYSGETPYIISLPNGYSEPKELVNLYNTAEANSVLIEDAVGTMNENSLLPLLREKKEVGVREKILLLSTENDDSVKYMPQNLLNYVAIVTINKFGIVPQTEFQFSDSKKVLEQFSVLNNFDLEYKKVRKLLFKIDLSNSYKLLRANIVAYVHQLSNVKEAIKGYARSELRILCYYNGFYIQVEKNINTYTNDFEKSLTNIIMGDSDE